MAKMEGSKKLGSHVEKQTALIGKKFPHEQKQTKPTSAKGAAKNIKSKDTPHVGEVMKTKMKGNNDGKTGERSAKRPEPDNMPPKRSSAGITGKGTTKAGGIKQSGSKAEKKLRDVRI